jgi:hypothetical protein
LPKAQSRLREALEVYLISPRAVPGIVSIGISSPVIDVRIADRGITPIISRLLLLLLGRSSNSPSIVETLLLLLEMKQKIRGSLKGQNKHLKNLCQVPVDYLTPKDHFRFVVAEE